MSSMTGSSGCALLPDHKHCSSLPSFRSHNQPFNHLMTETTTTVTTTGASSNVNLSPTQLSPRTWSCSTCQASFESGTEQRQHMKEPWHVCNLKRKVASLPPVSLDDFVHEHEPKPEDNGPKNQYHKAKVQEVRDEVEIFLPFHCLFCNESFEDLALLTDAPTCLARNIEHMRLTHGFLIPEQDSITDMGSFLGYLGTVVRVWHECIYCGVTRNSTQGVQSHMRDKRHCLLNLEKEPELLEFWEPEEVQEESRSEQGDETRTVISDTELRLSSGKIIASRQGFASTVKRARSRVATDKKEKDAPTLNLEGSRTAPVASELSNVRDRRVVRRDAMSLVGVTSQQQLALISAERTAQHCEAAARRSEEWAYSKRANSQKHDQAHGPLAKAKGGWHNLLPR